MDKDNESASERKISKEKVRREGERRTFPARYFAATGSPIAFASFFSRYSGRVVKLVNDPK